MTQSFKGKPVYEGEGSDKIVGEILDVIFEPDGVVRIINI